MSLPPDDAAATPSASPAVLRERIGARALFASHYHELAALKARLDGLSLRTMKARQWQGDLVFDGARFFEGTTPDLDLHCARLLRSAEIMGLAPTLTAAEIVDLTREGIRRLGYGVAPVVPVRVERSAS